jgi:Zn-finger nucleic acid-binding protein/glutaredoxin
MIRCPGCTAPMERRAFRRKPSGDVDLDFCHPCHFIWFDKYESTALTPASVIQLFGAIHQHHATPPRPVGERTSCPHCRRALELTHDLMGTNRFTYHRCPSGCGRLTTFFQFLREKHFVRSLAPHELAQLRAQVAQVRCSSCGAFLDLDRGTSCQYCRAPVSILDPDAVRRTLQDLSASERERQQVRDPGAVLDAVLEGHRPKRRVPAGARGSPEPSGGVLELVGDALDFLMDT